MYFYITVAKGKRICQARRNKMFIQDRKRTINKGEKCLVFSNGTIGLGARSYNYSQAEAVKMLRELLTALV